MRVLSITLDESSARRVPANDPPPRLVATGRARQRPLPLDLAARSHGELLAGLDLDSGVHRPRRRIAVAASSPRRAGGGGRGRGPHREGSARQRRRRHRPPAPVHARADRADHRPPGQGAVRSRPGQRREREHPAVRVRPLAAGQPIRGSAGGDPAALGKRRARRLRGAVLLAAPCPVGHRALRGDPAADLDRRQRPADARAHRPPRRRVVAGRGVVSRALRRDAFRRADIRRTRRPRSPGDHAVLHPGVPARRERRGAGRDPAGATGQGVPAAGVGRDVARLGIRTPHGRGLARIPGHRPRRAHPRADHRLPGQRAPRNAARRRAARHPERGRQDHQDLCGRGPAGTQDPRLRRHGGTGLRRLIGRECACGRRRIAPTLREPA